MLGNLNVQTVYNHLLRKTSAIDISVHRLCGAEIDNEKDKSYYKTYLDTIIDELNKIGDYLNDREFITNNKFEMIEEIEENYKMAPELIKRGFTYLIKLLQDFDVKYYLRYDRDIIILALGLLDDYIAKTSSSYLKEELIKIKYNAAMMYPFITKECVEKNFDFTGELHTLTDITTTLRSQTISSDENYSLDLFALSVIDVHASRLLKTTDDEFQNDVPKTAEAMFDYFMIESAMSFLSYDLSFEYFDSIIERNNILDDAYSIKLLKSLIGSKEKTRKRITKVSFVPFE